MPLGVAWTEKYQELNLLYVVAGFIPVIILQMR